MKKLSFILSALAGALLFAGCGGDDRLPNSPLTDEDFNNREQKFTKEEFNKDFENNTKKCSYVYYWTMGNDLESMYSKLTETGKKEDKELASKMWALRKKCIAADDFHFKEYPEYEKILGKVKTSF